MQKNIHRKSRLAIISDTGMCLKEGIYIFEPVFREVKNFSHLFGEIIWMVTEPRCGGTRAGRAGTTRRAASLPNRCRRGFARGHSR